MRVLDRFLVTKRPVGSGHPLFEEWVVKFVLAEPCDPVDTERTWFVSTVILDSAPDVFRLFFIEIGLDGRETAIPKFVAFTNNSSS